MKVNKLDYHGIKDVIVACVVIAAYFYALIAAPTSSVIFAYGLLTLLARVWTYSFMNCFIICYFGCYGWKITFRCFDY